MEQDQSTPIVKRWVGYVCPECHMIFRMEVGNGGRRAQCPGCEALVILGGKVPVAPSAEEREDEREDEDEDEDEDEEPEIEPQSVESLKVDALPVVAEEEGPEEPEDEHESAGEGEEPEEVRGKVRRKKVRKRKGVPKEPAWEKQVRKKKMKRVGWITPVVSVLCLMAVGAGVAYWAHSIVGWGSSGAGTLRGDMGIEEPGIPEVGVDTDVDVEDLAKVVQVFLGAETIDDLLETVRDRERLEPEIRRYYADGYAPTEIRKIAPDGGLQTTGGLFSVLVEMKDFSRKPIALEKVEDGFLVDWESWVGYSAMAWDEFMRRRPTGPAVFRVKTQKLDYYNFDFSDDKTWQSFRMESPDGQHTLYAYVPRYSEMVQALKPLDPKVKSSAHIVVLRYAEGASRPDQVLVEEVIASGWVVKDPEDPGQ